MWICTGWFVFLNEIETGSDSIPFDPTISSVVLPCAHERDLGLLVDGRLLRVHDGARDTEVNAAPEYIYLQ